MPLFKFHFVASYRFCFFVAGKIDEFKYDRSMDQPKEILNPLAKVAAI